jgi:MoaA/NifB/PqqE/SkfB family radical SAM enzyme
MKGISDLKRAGAEEVVNQICRLLGGVSLERMIQLTHLGELLTHDPEIKRVVRGVRSYLQDENHSARRLFARVMEYLPRENREKLFKSLFLHGFFLGKRKREEFAKENGYEPPLLMILSPSWQCNLRCKGCYTLGYARTSKGLSKEVVERILGECEEMGIFFVTILGGEPLMWPHLLDVIGSHPNIFFQVYTNGTLLTEEIARELSRLGNAALVFSIEGGEEETDSWRGKGVYAKIMHAMDLAREARLIIGTSATVTSQNVEVVSSDDFLDFMISKGSLAQMYFLYLPVNGKADFSLMVTPEQRDLLRRRVLTARRTKSIFIVDFWNDGPYVDGCIAGGRSYFHVNANGDVEPCVYTHIAVDNIHETSLKKALNSELFRAIRARQPHNRNHLRPCMIIDNPHVMREIIEELHPRFTHPGAEEIYTRLKDKMDEYAARYARLADEIWKKEYSWCWASCAKEGEEFRKEEAVVTAN